MRPRTILSWLVRSLLLTPPGSLSCSLSMMPSSTPFSSASISSWKSRSTTAILFFLLQNQIGEQYRLDYRLAELLFHQGLYRKGGLLAQFFLAFGRHQLFEISTTEQHHQLIAYQG